MPGTITPPASLRPIPSPAQIIMAEKYADLFEAGWRPGAEEVARDVRAVFGGSFADFLAK